MTILVMPSLTCNLKCQYCFERNVWESEVSGLKHNPDAIFSLLENVVRKYNANHVCLHGGEPLTLPLNELEYYMHRIRNMGLSISIQTNGTLITKEHIKLFKKYGVHVGISVDGPPEIDTIRGSDKKINHLLDKVINEMVKEKVSVGVLCVLSKTNATGDALDRLCEWIIKLSKMGIEGRLLKMRDFFGISREFELEPDEMANAWEKIYMSLRSVGMEYKWSPFRDFILSLQGRRKEAVCWLNECDPFCTDSCHVILPDATETICDRAFFMGLIIRPNDKNNIRQQILANTDCKGCRWFPNYCVGGCPLDGIDGDWRNKSKWCPAIYRMFEIISKEYPPMRPSQQILRGEHGDIPHGDFTNHGDSY
ncbi:MAG: radical SAM protein [Nitrososphaerota archaeon]